MRQASLPVSNVLEPTGLVMGLKRLVGCECAHLSRPDVERPLGEHVWSPARLARVHFCYRFYQEMARLVSWQPSEGPLQMATLVAGLRQIGRRHLTVMAGRFAQQAHFHFIAELRPTRHI